MDYPGKVAADYPDLLAIVEDKVKPEREKNRYSETAKEKWWLYERLRQELYSTIAGMEQVIVRAQVSRTHAPAFVNASQVFSMMCVVFPLKSYWEFSGIQSNLHETWVNEYSSSLKKDQRYTPSDCFDTFPFPEFPTPESRAPLEQIGERYYQQRQTIMQTRQEGLTKTYNRFHNPAETNPDIAELRRLHVAMDEAVAAAYGWQDLLPPDRRSGLQPATETAENADAPNRGLKPAPTTLGHGFHETKQGIRYTISEEARREVLDRLLELNHQRYAEEVAAGLHEKKTGKPAARSVKPAVSGQLDAFASLEDGERESEHGVRVPGFGNREDLVLPNPEPRAPHPGGSEPRALLDYLQSHPGWHSKDALLTATGFPAHRWNAEIKRLLDSGQVEREGEKRGARYRFRGV